MSKEILEISNQLLAEDVQKIERISRLAEENADLRSQLEKLMDKASGLQEALDDKVCPVIVDESRSCVAFSGWEKTKAKLALAEKEIEEWKNPPKRILRCDICEREIMPGRVCRSCVMKADAPGLEKFKKSADALRVIACSNAHCGYLEAFPKECPDGCDTFQAYYKPKPEVEITTKQKDSNPIYRCLQKIAIERENK